MKKSLLKGRYGEIVTDQHLKTGTGLKHIVQLDETEAKYNNQKNMVWLNKKLIRPLLRTRETLSTLRKGVDAVFERVQLTKLEKKKEARWVYVGVVEGNQIGLARKDSINMVTIEIIDH